jgi:branched-chain amino acid transport system ATP-binding protein
VTDQVSIDVRPGELHAVIGPNGAGKTTLINQLSGELASDAGQIHFEGREIGGLPIHRRAREGLLRSYQITSIFEEFTVLENATLAAMATRSSVWRFWRSLLSDRAAVAVAREAISSAGLQAQTDVPAGELAYGQRRQLELAMALAAKPKFLLLDEPMAGMSVQESAAVIELLRDLKRRYAILLVEHDMDAVFSLADRITVLVYGRVMFTGTADEVRSHPEVRAVYLGEEDF